MSKGDNLQEVVCNVSLDIQVDFKLLWKKFTHHEIWTSGAVRTGMYTPRRTKSEYYKIITDMKFVKIPGITVVLRVWFSAVDRLQKPDAPVQTLN